MRRARAGAYCPNKSREGSADYEDNVAGTTTTTRCEAAVSRHGGLECVVPELGGEPLGASAMLPLGSAEFDRYLVSPEFVADPYTTLHRLQSEAPIHWSDSVGGWLVTRYDDIMPTFRNTKDYSNEGRLGVPPVTSLRQTVKSYACSKSIIRQKGCCTPTLRTTHACVGLQVKRSRPAGSRALGQISQRSPGRCWTSMPTRAVWK